ncbi:aminotransferase class V-fold PLP-dependent enzyme [Chitinilyticum piscinae]|uniref:Aminotransferase class V-fold PLP-dependent enzyme n=1 Tax=Chitinilyticum piscinae TaxID=2866724 RepID=A0A8J7FY92_9NEIS|nr:aminotransferase class V-fold PLP-dependent enzyme [Chitinilyticum piscinae]MBE9607913.1 aminotransferase class V-fold PLP-dependent enzyme [Chitinilyticum piscinae]
MSTTAALACNEIYLDANATTALLPAAQVAMLRTLTDNYGNPGSPHGAGIRARLELERARNAAAAVLRVPAGQLIFNSGATEGIQTAVLSALHTQQAGSPVRVLYGSTEHKAVPEALAHWGELLGLNLELLAIPVDSVGRHDLDWLARHAAGAALICTMAANNETGVITDLAGIGTIIAAQTPRPLWLVDGVQAFGKLDIDWLALGADYVPLSGHKLHAPKGSGILYVRDGAPFTRLLAGGGQEGNARCGTENLPGIAAIGAVCEALAAGEFGDPARLLAANARLRAAVSSAFPGVVFNSPAQHCLPTTINFSVPGVPSKRLLEVFDALGLRLSAGSACSSKTAKPSHVLMAMGLGEERATSAIRLSISPWCDATDIDAAVARLQLCGSILESQAAAMAALEQVALPEEDQELSDRYAITASQLPDWRARHAPALFIDIREPWEQAASGICPTLDGMASEQHPLSQLAQWLPQWPHQHSVLLACRSGRRSGQLLSHLRQQGYENVWHLAEGLAGLPQPR